MDVAIRYPVFVVTKDIGTGHIPVAANSDHGECFLTFQTKELAELYLDQIQRVNEKDGLMEMDELAFHRLLRENGEVKLVAWNHTATAHNLVFLDSATILGQSA